MKAFVKDDPDAPSIRPAEVSIPQPDAGEVLVRLGAVGVGIHDSSFLPPQATYPVVIGIEGAGTIERVGDGVGDLHPGDRVAFVSSMQPKGGTWAEYAVVDASSLILPVPAGLDVVEAAALPVAGNTALRAFAALPALPAGATIFIAGGAGAIGSLAIQVARARDWRVAASASAHNHDYLRELGAQLCVDYHDPSWPEEVRAWMPGGVDAAFAVHPGTSAATMGVVRDGGNLVTISGDALTPSRGVQLSMINYQADVRPGLAQLMAEVAAGTMHLEIERVYPFDEAPEALARVGTRHVRGKLVLRVDDSVLLREHLAQVATAR